LKSMTVNFSIFSGQQNRQIWTWTTVISFGEYSEEQILACNISEETWRCSLRSMV
jgi:hypothetical protein